MLQAGQLSNTHLPSRFLSQPSASATYYFGLFDLRKDAPFVELRKAALEFARLGADLHACAPYFPVGLICLTFVGDLSFAPPDSGSQELKLLCLRMDVEQCGAPARRTSGSMFMYWFS